MTLGAQPDPALEPTPMSTPWLDMAPDALLSLLFFALAIDPLIGEPFAEFWSNRSYAPLDFSHPTLLAVVLIEVGFLFPQLTLTDVTTRLQKRPPWWIIPPLAIGLLVIAPGGAEFFRAVLANQSLLLMPALWSVFLRARQLWLMPGKSSLERMRVRALTAGRANVGGLMVVIFLGATMIESSGLVQFDGAFGKAFPELALAAVYFAACTFDIWRVARPRFARDPKPLLWLDIIDVKYVDAPL
jgi:hypothetical protein